MLVLTILAWVCVLPVAGLLGVLLVEVTLGIFPADKSSAVMGGAVPRTIILMPAHNEARGIGAILTSVQPALPEGMSIWVVADNCSDDTAAIARSHGVHVLQRQDAERRGKGYALAFGRDAMLADPPECVIVLDADCEVEGNALAELAQAAVREGVPVQSCYLMRPDKRAGPMVEISNFAFLIKNMVRQRGVRRLGAPAVLVGTGMAFPWSLFVTAPLATADLVEDLALGIALTRYGHPPRFLEQARTWSRAASGDDTLAQRTRWEHGFIGTALRQALPLAGEALRGGSPRRLWLALHLLVPPLALLMLMVVGVWALALLCWVIGAAAAPAIIMTVLLAATILALGAAWFVNGRAMLGTGTLMRIPLYILWKIPVYLRLVRKPETQWVRTRRDGE